MPEKNRYARELDLTDDFDATELASRPNRFDRLVGEDLNDFTRVLRGGCEVLLSKSPDTKHVQASLIMPNGPQQFVGRFAGTLPAILGIPALDTRLVPEASSYPSVLDAEILRGSSLLIKWSSTGTYSLRLSLPLGTHTERVGGKVVRYRSTSVRKVDSLDLLKALQEIPISPAFIEHTLTL